MPISSFPPLFFPSPPYLTPTPPSGSLSASPCGDADSEPAGGLTRTAYPFPSSYSTPPNEITPKNTTSTTWEFTLHFILNYCLSFTHVCSTTIITVLFFRLGSRHPPSAVTWSSPRSRSPLPPRPSSWDAQPDPTPLTPCLPPVVGHRRPTKIKTMCDIFLNKVGHSVVNHQRYRHRLQSVNLNMHSFFPYYVSCINAKSYNTSNAHDNYVCLEYKCSHCESPTFTTLCFSAFLFCATGLVLFDENKLKTKTLTCIPAFMSSPDSTRCSGCWYLRSQLRAPELFMFPQVTSGSTISLFSKHDAG